MDARRNVISDLRGASRLGIDSTAGVIGLVRAMHADVARLPTALGGPVGDLVNAATNVTYRGIDGITRIVGTGIDTALALAEPLLGDVRSSQRRDGLIAALNGVLGDHLAETRNSLATTMEVRADGRAVALTPAGLAAAFPRSRTHVVILVHGLCMNERQWMRRGHSHGAALMHHLERTPVYVRYNTGLHVSTNGRALSEMLEALVAAWPVPLESIDVVAHSMGGLVVRSAHHHATDAGHEWVRRLRALVFLGTPHHGAPLERAGHRLHRLVEKTPYARAFARLGKIRSAGITDLRHGNLVDEDWQDTDRFAHGRDTRRLVPLPIDVRCFAVAATRSRSASDLQSRLMGDGLVPVPSALGHHEDAERTLAFPAAHQWIAHESNHFDLLGPGVYERLRGWLAD